MYAQRAQFHWREWPVYDSARESARLKRLEEERVKDYRKNYKGELLRIKNLLLLKAAAIDAFLEGKPIQHKNEYFSEGWADYEGVPMFDNVYSFYRPKP